MIRLITQNGEWIINIEKSIFKRKQFESVQDIIVESDWEPFYNYEISMEDQSVLLSLTQDGKRVIKSWFYSCEDTDNVDDLAEAVGVLKV